MIPKTKAAIEEAAKLPTMEQSFNDFAKSMGYKTWSDMRNAFCMDGFALNDRIFKAAESHTAAHTAALRERVKELEFGAQVDSDCIESQSNEIDELKAWKESAMAEAEKLDIQSIGMEIGCKLGSSIPEQVLPWIRDQKAKIASYESAIDGLKKVVDSLYNLRS